MCSWPVSFAHQRLVIGMNGHIHMHHKYSVYMDGHMYYFTVFHLQVLKSGSCIDVQQDDAYGDILLRELPRLKQPFEADGLGSKS